MQRRWSLAAALLLAVGVAFAGTPGVRVQDAWARATPAAAPVAGGFLTLVNDGDQPDTLLRVESDAAARVEIHQMRNDGGVMRMRAMPDGVVVPAHGRLELKPGGYHLMLINPRRALAPGDHFDATLVFQRGGRVTVRYDVRALGAGA